MINYTFKNPKIAFLVHHGVDDKTELDEDDQYRYDKVDEAVIEENQLWFDNIKSAYDFDSDEDALDFIKEVEEKNKEEK